MGNPAYARLSCPGATGRPFLRRKQLAPSVTEVNPALRIQFPEVWRAGPSVATPRTLSSLHVCQSPLALLGHFHGVGV
jgi:hypothetical protein